MKRAVAALLAGLALATGTGAVEVRLVARDSLRVPTALAQAAFSLDPSIVEASLVNGEVVLRGRRAGRAMVTVVYPTTVQTLSVVVEAAPLPVLDAASTGDDGGATGEARYDGATRRFTTSVAAKFGDGARTTRVRLEGLYERAREGASSNTALPFVSIEIESPARKVVLLDERVEGSALGIDHVVLRGIHWREGPWEVHAGIASATPFEDFIVPGSGDRALGVSLRIPRGGLTFVPGVLWLPDSDASTRGVVSLGVLGQTAGGRLKYTGELGWGGRPGGAFDVQLSEPGRQAWISAALRPDGFAALREARPPGSRVEGAWTEWFGERTSASLSGSVNRLDIPGVRPETASLRLDVRHQLDDRWSVSGTAGGGGYRSITNPTSRRATLGMGVSYDRSEFGASAQYRYQQVSGASGGHGARLGLRASGTGWRTTFFVDAQQQAVTLDLLLQDRPDLARAVAELGITASDPEDLVRQLRDHAALLGSRGATLGDLRVSPLRLQAGLDASWRGPGRGAPGFGLRLLADDVQTSSGSHRSFVGTLYASWEILPQTELGIGYSRWSLRQEGLGADTRGAFQVWLRTHLSKLDAPWEGVRAITGRVTRDDAADGTGGNAAAPIAGVEIVLDRIRRTHTDAEGRYAFDHPGGGAHRVEAQLPRAPGAYFTSPSMLTVKPGEEARFSVTFSAARVSGTVQSDAGRPLAGVTVRLEGASPASTVTDAEGVYRLAAPAGDARIVVVGETLPPGYDLAGLAPKKVALAPAAPVVADFSFRAQRAIQGTVRGMSPEIVRVVVVETGREVRTDAAGRFTLRGLPAGKSTLLVRGRDREWQHEIRMPVEPTVVKDVVLSPP